VYAVKLITFLHFQWPGSVTGQINSTSICLLVIGLCCQVKAYSPAAAKWSASNWQVVTLQVESLTLYHGTALYLGEILWNEPAGKTQLTRPGHSWTLKWLFKKQDRWERTRFTGIGTRSKLLRTWRRKGILFFRYTTLRQSAIGSRRCEATWCSYLEGSAGYRRVLRSMRD
jgi:hypothetical protein